MDSSVLVLDASAFYAGIPFLGASKCYTTNLVFDEVRHIKKSQQALEALIDAGILGIIDPEEKYLKQAGQMARKSGDAAKTSAADISILALALHFRAEGMEPAIVTDDYAVANVAELEEIKVSYVMTKGIRKVGRWVRYCSACGISYGSDAKICRVCGNKLRAKLRAKKQH